MGSVRVALRYTIVASGIITAAILLWTHILSNHATPNQSNYFHVAEEAPLTIGEGGPSANRMGSPKPGQFQPGELQPEELQPGKIEPEGLQSGELQTGGLKLGGSLPGVTLSRVPQPKRPPQILVQRTTTDDSTDCKVLHVGVVATGYDSCRHTSVLVKSLLMHTPGSVHFHFMVDSISGVILKRLMGTWQLPINVSFYTMEEARKAVLRHGLVLGESMTSSAFSLPFILPPDISFVMVFTEPIVITVNILTLMEKVDTTTSTLSAERLGGARIYLFNVQAILSMAHEEVLKLFQPFLNPEGNQLYKSADRGLASLKLEQCCMVATVNKCLQTVSALTSIGTDGCPQNILRKVLNHNCSNFPENNTCIQQPKPTIIASTSGSCKEFRKRLIYCTHPYYIGHLQHNTVSDPFDVTMVTHLTFDRLPMFMRVLQSWSGPASVAVYVNETESIEIIKFVETNLPQQENVMFHIVYEAGVHYPINYLRNVAWNYSDTPYIFITDADLIPVPTMYESLKTFLRRSNDNKKNAYVVPAFETLRLHLPYPIYKKTLVTQLQYKAITPFKWKYFKEGHKPTDYDKWRKATTPYKVKWHKLYEPYIVVHYGTRRFDERFVGYGSNKASHIEELYAQRYSFVVLPNVYTIHYPHSASAEESKFRGTSVRGQHHKSSSVYFHCIDIITKEFRKELQKKYGVKI